MIGRGRPKKYDYHEERLKTLRFLYEKRNLPGERTRTGIMKHLDLGHDASFNRIIYWLDYQR